MSDAEDAAVVEKKFLNERISGCEGDGNASIDGDGGTSGVCDDDDINDNAVCGEAEVLWNNGVKEEEEALKLSCR